MPESNREKYARVTITDKVRQISSSNNIQTYKNGDGLNILQTFAWLYAGKVDQTGQATLWYPGDGFISCVPQRSRGHKGRRWEDELKKTVGPLCMRLAADREQQRELGEAYAVRHKEE